METELISIDGPGPLNPIGEPVPMRPPIDWTRPVQTVQGTPVKVYAIDHTLGKHPVVAITKSGCMGTWRYDGIFHLTGMESCLDLENVPTTQPEARP